MLSLFLFLFFSLSLSLSLALSLYVSGLFHPSLACPVRDWHTVDGGFGLGGCVPPAVWSCHCQFSPRLVRLSESALPSYQRQPKAKPLFHLNHHHCAHPTPFPFTKIDRTARRSECPSSRVRVGCVCVFFFIFVLLASNCYSCVVRCSVGAIVLALRCVLEDLVCGPLVGKR